MRKILIVNYRYFLSGGPEKYMFNIKKTLEKQGNAVILFSIKHSKNVETPYSSYFVQPIGGEEVVYYSQYKKTPKTIMQLISRSFYSTEVRKALSREIIQEAPDCIYILHHVNKLSPSVISAAKEHGKKVVVRLSDFYLLCPRFDFLKKGEICEKCLQGSLINAVKNNCVQESKMASIIRVMSMYFHRLIRIYNLVDYFVSPSAFLRTKLIEFGFNAKKIIHIPTFIEFSEISPNYVHQDYILYIGRLNEEKGVEYVIRAMQHVTDSNLKLKIVGTSSDNRLIQLNNIVEEKKLKNVEFLGFKSGEELDSIISNSKFTIVPSVWYDNMPNVVLEAFAHGKPVIASSLGSLPEIIIHGTNGLLFKPKDFIDLAKKIDYLNSDEKLIRQLGQNAREKVEKEYNSQLHYERLSKILF